MKLVGVGFSNFRSIGEAPVFIDLEKRVTILIGANNSGKSNLIRALKWLSDSDPRGLLPVDPLDYHRRNSAHLLRVVLRARLGAGAPPRGLPADPIELTLQRSPQGALECIGTPFEGLSLDELRPLYEHHTGDRLPRRVTAEALMPFRKELGLAMAVGLLADQMPRVEVVPQFRRITPGEAYGVSGQGITEALASWQVPDIGRDANHQRFARIQELLRQLLHAPEVVLQVSRSKQLIVQTKSLRLPLESLGTGVHELIILAAAVGVTRRALVCVEEPEIHLHPRLQKEFLHYLVQRTENTYVVSTHSNAFLQPSEDTAIVHLRSGNGVTRSRIVETSAQALQVLSDLGVQASDLLQANSVVWVEGPSDRIYLNRWLELVAPDLREGIHYAIMFYGGRLLSHLSLERDPGPEVEELIALLRINQHSAIVMDSERDADGAALNPTKRRVQEECQRNGICCWVTRGKEIENYLPARAVVEAYAEQTSQDPPGLALAQYAGLEEALTAAYGQGWDRRWSYDRAKPLWARRIAAHIAPADVTAELRAELERLAAMIRAAS